MISLNDIEHRILRPLSNDPRIHYALNCASLGCPTLNKVPFTSLNMEDLLESSSFNFVNHSNGLFFKKEELHVSSIYVWFRSDFETKGFEGVYAEPFSKAEKDKFTKIQLDVQKDADKKFGKKEDLNKTQANKKLTYMANQIKQKIGSKAALPKGFC